MNVALPVLLGFTVVVGALLVASQLQSSTRAGRRGDPSGSARPRDASERKALRRRHDVTRPRR